MISSNQTWSDGGSGIARKFDNFRAKERRMTLFEDLTPQQRELVEVEKKNSGSRMPLASWKVLEYFQERGHFLTGTVIETKQP
jgi:hypothetical protein